MMTLSRLRRSVPGLDAAATKTFEGIWVSHVRVDDAISPGCELDVSDVRDLFDLFSQVSDPRDRRGVRHSLASVLTVVVFAVLTGAVNFRELADRVKELPVVLCVVMPRS